MIIRSEDFYRNYQLNYFDYKLMSIKWVLDSIPNIPNADKILDFNEADFTRTIRSAIRQTYFQAVETIFELIFSLTPDENNKVDEHAILNTITGANSLRKIEEISKDSSNLNFLDQMITFENTTSTLGSFIFFRGMDEAFEKDFIKTNLQAIKRALHQMAADLGDRSEYNSYKHCMRPLPLVAKMELVDPVNGNPIFTTDLKNSITYLKVDGKSKQRVYVTKTLDTERDIKMTELASLLIWNIIVTRNNLYEKKLVITIPTYTNAMIDDYSMARIDYAEIKASTIA